GMPIIEDRRVAFKETRIDELAALKDVMDGYRDLILNVRVGGTDFSSCFGVRRGINYTIYDILPVADCLKDVLNIFARNDDYVVSGPVWEYFRASKEMKFKELPDTIDSSLLKTRTFVNDAIDGLLREVLLDKANSFIGKTIIHPTHIPYVNGMYAVTEEIYKDACQILNTAGGVIKSENDNKMNEIGPHHNWATRIFKRSSVYGVIKDEASYIKIFEAGNR
ncbi:MAG: HpcH/HpaI aldolase/citrate lyase family protein, partial [Erysipelotrichaceae bacterium]|nr:HpcH/HpaI aldolase/citrate lyase family protein [Erysipelotrichaceae bacterium]